MPQIRIFTTQPYCPSSDDPDCCGVPGFGQKELGVLVEAIEKEGWQAEVCEIRDIKFVDAFPQAIRLFKQYRYDALPILMVGQEVAAYGIPDKEFIIHSIKNKL